ncbi:hypothetical protein [Pendulispora albinea]|uniref:Uncharacterized protein n=1 Tax=Pendulispora albinea TaxID=2741071 RepID=A0ABZ2LSM1_9BACT
MRMPISIFAWLTRQSVVHEGHETYGNHENGGPVRYPPGLKLQKPEKPEKLIGSNGTLEKPQAKLEKLQKNETEKKTKTAPMG